VLPIAIRPGAVELYLGSYISHVLLARGLTVSRHQRDVIPRLPDPDPDPDLKGEKTEGGADSLPGAKEASLPIVNVEVELKVGEIIRQLYRNRVRKEKQDFPAVLYLRPVGSRDMAVHQSAIG
jgi:hypothetical protein